MGHLDAERGAVLGGLWCGDQGGDAGGVAEPDLNHVQGDRGEADGEDVGEAARSWSALSTAAMTSPAR